uniref:ATP synthase 8 n=1 Tax=Proasellus aragonensis TaxID=1281939 RepID=A0A485M742_9CRUS|nr:ATP synthase 8 [Proasellus aragonensis]
MPQMAPMFWTFLMLLFTIAFMVIMVKLYFYVSSCSIYMISKISHNMKNQWPW